MLHWFQKTLISDTSADWIHACMAWALEHFDAATFASRTVLVTPDAKYFPSPVTSAEEMAQYVLKRVTELAGLEQWPWRLTPAELCPSQSPALLHLPVDQRHTSEASPAMQEQSLAIPFNPQQLKKPQDLVASTAQNCAQHMLWQSQLMPPGGANFFQQTAEVLAVFLGFGIVLTNSAYTFRGSCAKCYDPRANRQASLSEAEVLYALALFCRLKDIPATEVVPHLKPHLRGNYKVCIKQVDRHASAPPVLPTPTHKML